MGVRTFKTVVCEVSINAWSCMHAFSQHMLGLSGVNC
jgi:hypothetical protein